MFTSRAQYGTSALCVPDQIVALIMCDLFLSFVVGDDHESKLFDGTRRPRGQDQSMRRRVYHHLPPSLSRRFQSSKSTTAHNAGFNQVSTTITTTATYTITSFF